MNSTQYTVVPHPKLKRDYRGRMVRLTRDIANGFGKLPAGAVGVIEHQSPKGSEFLGQPCAHCGLQMRVSRLTVDDIEFVESVQNEADETITLDERWAKRGGILYDFVRERLCLGLYAMGNYSISSELPILILSGQSKGEMTNVRKSDLRMATMKECDYQRVEYIEAPSTEVK